MSKQKLASKAILQYLAGRGRTRTERLREAVCDPPPKGEGICTPKIFYRCLADLVEVKCIKKFEVSRNEIYYSTPDWVEYENEITEDVVNHAHYIQKDVKRLKSVPAVLAKKNQGSITEILYVIFTEIMYMYKWATLLKLRDPAKNSLAVDNIIKNTCPDLVKLFSTAIEKSAKERSLRIDALLEEDVTIRMIEKKNGLSMERAFNEIYAADKKKNL